MTDVARPIEKRVSKRRPRPAAGRGWAWAIETLNGTWTLCNWAEPYRDGLASHNRPSPEALRVYVKISPMPRKRK